LEKAFDAETKTRRDGLADLRKLATAERRDLEAFAKGS
jgi:hypothetical protein